MNNDRNQDNWKAVHLCFTHQFIIVNNYQSIQNISSGLKIVGVYAIYLKLGTLLLSIDVEISVIYIIQSCDNSYVIEIYLIKKLLKKAINDLVVYLSFILKLDGIV